MLKVKRNKIQPKYIVIIIIAILILFLVVFSYSIKKKENLNSFESLIKDVVTFSEKVISYPFIYLKGKMDEFHDLNDVKKENNILNTSLDRIESIETENVELRRQIDKLKSELNIDYTLTDYEYLNATIISRDIGYWYNTLTLNKGSYSGVENDMVVINAYGLIGKVISTTTFTSTVRLITTSDTNNKISVMVDNGEKQLYGVITKYDYSTNTLKLEGISNTLEVNVGNRVYTSGMGGVFPGGILIGTVSEITTDEYDLAKIINVIPSVDFTDLNYVSILKRSDNQ